MQNSPRFPPQPIIRDPDEKRIYRRCLRSGRFGDPVFRTQVDLAEVETENTVGWQAACPVTY
jgi:hypothetical protein